jgi:hypothetical protein
LGVSRAWQPAHLWKYKHESVGITSIELKPQCGHVSFDSRAVVGSMGVYGLTSELTGRQWHCAARRMLRRTARGAMPLRVRVERPVRLHQRFFAGGLCVKAEPAADFDAALVRPSRSV